MPITCVLCGFVACEIEFMYYLELLQSVVEALLYWTVNIKLFLFSF